MIDARGAPADQGEAQGRLLGEQVRSAVRAQRARHGFFGWRAALLDARHTGLAIQRFMPQQFERLEGIALAARVPLAALELLASAARVGGVGTAGAASLEARFDLPAEIETRLALRATTPDAGGFPSVELTAAAFAGALAGVNANGVCMLVLEDRGVREAPVPVLGQDVLLRAATLESALQHLRLRVQYAGATGSLLLGDATGDARRVELRGHRFASHPAERAQIPAEASSVLLDPRGRRIRWRDPQGKLVEGVPGTNDGSARERTRSGDDRPSWPPRADPS